MAMSTDQNGISEPTVSLKEPSEEDNEVADDEGEGGGEAGAPPAQQARVPGQQRPQGKQGTRKDRRAAFQGATEQIESRLRQSMQNELGQFKSQFQQMLDSARQKAAPQQGAAAPGPSAFDNRMGELDRAIQAELSAFQAHDHRTGRYDLTRHNALKREQEKLVARAEAVSTLRELGITPEMLQQMKQGGQREQGTGNDPHLIVRFEKVAEQYPWIREVQNASAVGRYKNYLVHGLGRPDNVETDMEAASRVQNELGLGQRNPPRARPGAYAGIPGGERAGGGAQREVRLPAAAMRGLSADEVKAIQSQVFSEE
jgi:hypothetical protein